MTTDLNRNEIKKLVIVGGGSAGWIAAAALSRKLKQNSYSITVIESSHISAIGVGESVLQSLPSFVRTLGMDEQAFVQRTGATCKLGIQFQDWLTEGGSYFHPFGAAGPDYAGHDFFQLWLKARSEGDSTPLTDYFASAVMAGRKRAALPFNFPAGSPLANADHSYHLDSALMVGYLREFAEKLNVRTIRAHVVRINRNEDGSISSLELNNRQSIEGDFFIDCSGFRGLLIEEALKSPVESWKHFLPCDRALVVQTAHRGKMMPYTVSTARESGWTWHIPLQDRISNGYVFSSAHCNDEQAIRTLLGSLKGRRLTDTRFIPLRVGMREALWKKNCIALGLAGGFLEPLESTAIHLVTRGVQLMLELFPRLPLSGQDWPSLAAEYNTRMRMDYEEIRDFIILHYHLSRRSDTEFWRAIRSYPLPGTLTEKIALFKARGELRISARGLFGKTSWQAVFTGMGVIPETYHPFVDLTDFASIREFLESTRVNLDKAVLALPAYQGA